MNTKANESIDSLIQRVLGQIDECVDNKLLEQLLSKVEGAIEFLREESSVSLQTSQEDCYIITSDDPVITNTIFLLGILLDNPGVKKDHEIESAFHDLIIFLSEMPNAHVGKDISVFIGAPREIHGSWEIFYTWIVDLDSDGCWKIKYSVWANSVEGGYGTESTTLINWEVAPGEKPSVIRNRSPHAWIAGEHSYSEIVELIDENDPNWRIRL
jgi:hypothetical protein